MVQQEEAGLGVTQHGKKGGDKNRFVAFGRNLKYLKSIGLPKQNLRKLFEKQRYFV